MYMFVFRGVPMPESPDYQRFSQAFIHVWVVAPSSEVAETLARAYITRLHWDVEAVEHAFEIPRGQPLQLEEHEAQLRERAERFGIAADIVAVPRQDNLPQ